MLNILFPIPYSIEVSRLRQQLDEAHLAWATEWKRQQLDFKIENIRFNHDPAGTSGFSDCRPPATAKPGSGASLICS
jgi:hypothetical protein